MAERGVACVMQQGRKPQGLPKLLFFGRAQGEAAGRGLAENAVKGCAGQVGRPKGVGQAGPCPRGEGMLAKAQLLNEAEPLKSRMAYNGQLPAVKINMAVKGVANFRRRLFLNHCPRQMPLRLYKSRLFEGKQAKKAEAETALKSQAAPEKPPS